MMLQRIKLLLVGSLRRQLVLGLALTVALTMSVYVWMVTSELMEENREQQSQQVTALVKSVAASTSLWVASRDYSGLQEIIQGLSHYPDLRYAIILDNRGQILAHSDTTRIGQYLTDLPARDETTILNQTSNSIDVYCPITLTNMHIGWVRVSFSNDLVDNQLTEMMRVGIIFTLIAVLLSILIAVFAGSLFTRRLNAIHQVAYAVQRGESDRRAELIGDDEAARLARRFNEMLDTLWNREIELKKANEKTLAILRNASDGIHILDMDGNLIEASDSFCSMLGYQRDEMIGMNVSVWDAFLPGDDLKNIVRNQISKKERSEFESRHRRKDGSLFDVEISGFPLVLDGLPVLFNSSRDITRRKIIEDAMRESEARFRQMFEGHSAIMLLVDPSSGSIVDANLAAEKFYGYPMDHLCSMKIEEINTQSKEEVEREMRNAYEQHRNYFVFEHRLNNGTVRTVEVHSSPIILKGVKLLFSIIHDISERRKAEESFLISASVFENSQDAIAITDQNNLIIDVNPAFTVITGYARDEVVGKNPKLLNSGRQDKTFYAEMWQALKQKKKWRGEIWNRRKSGEVYAEMISISAIYDNESKLLRYVAVFSDITHIKVHEAELSRVAHYDALTGIPNRLLLADRMKQAIAQTSRDQTLMAVCYLDLDGFKPINDSMGHEAGDEVLVEVAKRIANTLRGGDTIARLGGDEFVALLLGQSKGEECVATLERLLVTISHPMTVKSKPVTVSASIGVSIYPMDDEDPDTLLRHADQAMYIAKQSGKNRFHIYDPELDRRARDQHEFLKTIRHALENNQFELHYQPKVNLRTKKLVGAEALIRWRHPARGILPPSEFLHYVENTDLDIEIGEWVTATALAQMNQWRQSGLDIEVSVNITGYHLDSFHFIEKLRKQIEIYPESQFGKLQIEVLETVALNDINVVREIIGSCRELGVRFALDDFGTGYSSLSYLSRLPVDTLKIDQSFVRDILDDKGDRAIVQGIIALASAFERQTVAEGIETAAHYQLLLEMGCELGQGYGIARPMPANELPAWSESILW